MPPRHTSVTQIRSLLRHCARYKSTYYYFAKSLKVIRPSTQYNLRAKTHNKDLIVKTPHLTDRDYIVRMLYKNILLTSSSDINFFTYFSIIHFYCLLVASDNFLHTTTSMIMMMMMIRNDNVE